MRYLILLFSIFAAQLNAQYIQFGFNPGLPSYGAIPVQTQFTSCVTGGVGDSTCTTPNEGNVSDSGYNWPIPSLPGSVKMVCMVTGNADLTISSVQSLNSSGGDISETWSAPSGLHRYNSGNDNVACAYTTSGTANVYAYTITMSGDLTGYAYWIIYEFLPPSGMTTSLDTDGTSTGGCTGAACNGVALTTSGTDIIFQMFDNGVWEPNAWNSCGSSTIAAGSYFPDYSGGGCDAYNVASGSVSAPVLTSASTPTYNTVVAASFKFSGGAFKTYNTFTAVNYSNPTSASALSCEPTCSMTINSTGSGNALLGAVETESEYVLSSCSSSSGTCVVEATKEQSSPQSSASIFEILNTTASATSVSLTMSGSTTSVVAAVGEFSRSSGSWTNDGAPTCQTNIAEALPPGPAQTLTGVTDVIMQTGFIDGGASTMQYYPLFTTFAYPSDGYFADTQYFINTNEGSAPLWAYPFDDSGQSASITCSLAVK